MNRRTNRLLSAASLVILFLAIVPGMAYTGAWSGPEGGIDIIIAETPASGHHHDQVSGHSHTGDFQQCRVGPSKCTSHPSFVSTTTIGDEAWTAAPPQLSHEIFGPGRDLAYQPPVYRMKPPPRDL